MPAAPRAAVVNDVDAAGSVLLQRLAGKPADEVLSRIANGDPLKLYGLCAQRIRDTHFVLDPDRVFERALAQVAIGVQVEPALCTRPEWLVERVDRAIRRVLDHDAEEERDGLPAEDPEQQHRLFVEAFYIEPGLARLSSVRFNGLGERIRKGFYHLIIEGRPLEEVLAMELGSPNDLQRDILTGLLAIGVIDEEGFEELRAKEPQP